MDPFHDQHVIWGELHPLALLTPRAADEIEMGISTVGSR